MGGALLRHPRTYSSLSLAITMSDTELAEDPLACMFCGKQCVSLFGDDGKMERADYLSTWKAIDEATEAVSTVV